MVDQQKPVWWRRALRRTLTLGTTSLVMAGAGGAVLLGSTQLANRAGATPSHIATELTPVEVAPLILSEGFEIPRQFVGQVEAAASVALSFELGGRLEALEVAEGEAVTAGALLARLDTSLLLSEQDRLTASRTATQAQLTLAETRLTRAQALLSGGHVSQEAVDQALATRDELASRMAEIEAGLSATQINLDKSELRAPFDGIVGGRNVDGQETLGAGAPVLTLIETRAPEVRVGLPLSVDPTMLGAVTITVSGTSYPATLSLVRPDIDPVTRTRTALFQLEGDATPAFGQTATLTLATEVAVPGTWVPLDALQEGAGGGWTLLVVEDQVVRTALVGVIHADDKQAYVAGTFPPGAQMIRTGAHRVVPSQEVRVVTGAEAL